MAKEKVSVGILGAGFMGKAHAECYDMFDCHIEMIAARSEDSAKAVAERYGARWTTDIHALIGDPAVDCVDITLPNFLHHEAAMACIRAGKPFVIEKPLARNAAEAKEIVEAAKAKGIVALYGENIRFKPAMVKTKKLIDEGAFGKIMMMRANEIHNGPFHSPWFWDAELTGGGAVIDMGIHGLFALEWIMGSRIKRVYAETDVLKWKDYCKNGSEDSAFVVARFENGGIAEMMNSWAISGGIDVRMEIFGTNGTVYMDSTRGQGGVQAFSQEGYGKQLDVESSLRPHVSSSKGWSWPTPDEWTQHGHAYEVKHFIDCVRGIEQPRCTLEEGLRALELVEAIYESARAGKPVEL